MANKGNQIYNLQPAVAFSQQRNGKGGGKKGSPRTKRNYVLRLLALVIAINTLYSTIHTFPYIRVNYYFPSMEDEGPSYFWENADNCLAVENICHAHPGDDQNDHRWFYFEGEQQNGKNYKPNQPSVKLDETMKNVHFRVSSAVHRPPLHKLRKSSMNCTLSHIDNHVVLQSQYNDMIGEFYSRSLLPLSQLFAVQHSSPNEHDKDNLQYYVHFVEEPDAKLFDAHNLFLSAMYTNHDAKNWADMFASDHATSECECYRRFVLCGYRETCDTGLEHLGIATNKLCQKGLNISTLQLILNMDGDKSVDRVLQKAGVTAEDRYTVVR